MQNQIKNISVIILLFLLISCGSYPCKRAASSIAFVSFTDAEIDTVICRRFAKATNFSTRKDSFILTKMNSSFQRWVDTVNIYQLPNGEDIITSDFDYEIFLPRVNRLFRLNEIAEVIQYGRRSTYKSLCGNTISSYKVNGQVMNDNYGNLSLYLKK